MKYSQYPDFPTTDAIKYDQLRKELEIISEIIKDIRDKEINDIETIFRIPIDHTHEINDPLLITHFLFKAVEEENNDLIKNNKPYRVDFGDDAGTHFINETRTYWEICNFNNDDCTLNHLQLGRHMETLDLIITGHTDDDELILFPKELKTADHQLILFPK